MSDSSSKTGNSRRIGASKLVTVFGGSGFVGRHVVRALAKRGYRVRAAVRRPDLANYLQPLGSVGQIHAVQANLRYRQSVEHAVAGADAVVNLVGILHESGRQKFDAIQGYGPLAVAQAARAAGLGTMVQMSALGADSGSASVYAKSKAEGEKGVLDTLPDSTILRPSIIFGAEDNFFNLFARMAQLSPVLPLIGGGVTRFQPVFVGDVAEAVARAVDGEARPGAVYELGGPEIKTFRECLELMLEIIDRKRLLAPVPFGLARLKARFLQLLPNPLLTVDQVRLLETDTVVSEAAIAERRTLEGLGIEPETLAAVLPSYLVMYRPQGEFSRREIAYASPHNK